MRVLEPSDVSRARNEDEQEAAARSRKLAVEERRLTELINKARDDARDTIRRIEDEHEAQRQTLAAERDGLQREVAELESRRRAALAPVDGIVADAERSRGEAQEAVARVQDRERALEAIHERNLEDLEALADRRAELVSAERSIEAQRVQLNTLEDRSQRTTELIASKWLELFASISKSNARALDLDQRASELATTERSIQSDRDELEKISIQISTDRKAIQDGYASLAAARVEILGRET